MLDKIWYLENLNLFSKMSMKEKMHLDKITVMSETDKFKPIFLPGDKANNIYIIKTGKVKISKLFEDGKQITLSILNPGDIIGEMSLLGEEEQNTVAEAIENTYLCIIEKNEFENLLLMNPILNLKITKLIGWRLRNIENRIENLIFKDVTSRIIHILLELAKSYRKETPEGIEIDLRLTHEELSQLVALNRQTVTTKLNELKQQGLIEIKRARIILKDIKKLEWFLNEKK
ncbi:MAG: Crp/Fnr family transcriptional regulator [Cyanobacteriota bacterium]